MLTQMPLPTLQALCRARVLIKAFHAACPPPRMALNPLRCPYRVTTSSPCPQQRPHSTPPPAFQRAQTQKIYRTLYEVYAGLVSPVYERTVYVHLPKFVFHEDVREHFEKSGFKVDRIIMAFDAEVAFNLNSCNAVLENKEAADAAIRELNGTALFSRKILIKPAKVLSEAKMSRFPDLQWGWWASDPNDYRRVDTLGVRLEPPKYIFRKRREGRTLSMKTTAYGLDARGLYLLLHKSYIECLSKTVKYQEVKHHDPRRKTEESMINLSFATREEADAALHELDRFIWKGIKLRLRRWQVLRKYYGVTWSSGRPGEHFSGLRDQESAVGTNFEYVQEELLAKALLGKHNRKIWVLGHTY